MKTIIINIMVFKLFSQKKIIWLAAQYFNSASTTAQQKPSFPILSTPYNSNKTKLLLA